MSIEGIPAIPRSGPTGTVARMLHPFAESLLVFAAPDPGSQGGILGGVAAWAVTVMDAIGAPGVALLILLENLFPPIPSEVILPLAGFAAAGETPAFTWWEAILWATTGSVVGAYVLYGLGAILGHRRTVWLFSRIPLVDDTDVHKTIDWFHRHGAAAVFFGRMLPIFRSLISIPAGIERMTWWRFGLYTLAGSLVWNTVFVVAGLVLGANWHIITEWGDWFQYLVIAVVLALLTWWVVGKLRSRRRARASASDSTCR